MKLQYHPILFATLISSFGGSNALKNSIRRTQVTTTDEGEESSLAHEGCKLLLKDLEKPNKMLVGAAYEAATNLDYHVATEAGPTAASCNNGQAGGYSCNNVNLSSMIGLSELKSGGSEMANDIWGWTHSTSGREFAIIGLKEGTSFVEITDEYDPVFVGFLPTKTGNSSWRDIKTIGDYALIVSEASNHGMQVFDLNQLLSAQSGSTFSESAHYGNFENAHNIFVNEDTGYAYAVGTNTCNGGLHIITMDNPLIPVFAGCYSSDGYTHDVQCVLYNGPDASYNGREICFASNEDTITIIDVTNKNNMVQLARNSYSGQYYTHQGWLTEDHTHFLFNDELDEYRGVTSKTRTHVFRVTDLNNPVYTGYHDGRTAAIDHNLYVLGDLVYQSNYRAGLNVLKIADIESLQFEEAGYFDVYPNSDSSNFNGAWSNYPYFPSGIVVVSGIEQGLFVLRYTGAASPTPQPANPTPQPVSPTPQPVNPTPQPVNPTPQPVNSTPQPVSPTPQPTNPAPQPTPDNPPVQSPATWGIDRVDQRNLPLDNTYGVSGEGAGVTAYIIDTGIRTSHNEFKNDSGGPRAIWGINTSGDGNDSDCNGHGTHVAGTVGGKTYGIAKNVELVAIKVLTCSGSGSTAGVIAGIEWAMDNAATNNKIATANLSLGGGKSAAMDSAVKNLHDSGVITVVAAGNSNTDACDASPAREPAVITVGSTTNSDTRSGFSNYGDCVDIFAPGSDITAAWIGSDTATRTISGTSMASPHVCGGAALLLGSVTNVEMVDDEIINRATVGKVTNAGTGSPNKLLYVGETGPTSSPTLAPPTPAPTPCQESTIIIDVKTDNYPLETSWNLINTCTNQDQANRPAGYYSNPNTSYNEEECAPTASYTFEMSDTFGDGLCCSYGSGLYRVTYNGVVEKEGGQFGSSESITFGSCNTPSPVLSPTSPVTSPTANPVEDPDEWETIFEEGFEDGSDHFRKVNRKIVSQKYRTGTKSVRMRKVNKIVSEKEDISDYSDLKVDFYFHGQGMENNEFFALDFKIGGSGWVEADRWIRGDDFENNEWYPATVTVSTNGSSEMQFRFRCKGDQGNDKIYIDDVTLSGK